MGPSQICNLKRMVLNGEQSIKDVTDLLNGFTANTGIAIDYGYNREKFLMFVFGGNQIGLKEKEMDAILKI